MTDDAFLAAFESATLTGDFTHRDHLRVALALLRQEGLTRGSERLLAGLRRFVAAKGAEAKYHVTLSLFWMRQVWEVLRAWPEVDTVDALLAHRPELGRSSHVGAFYSRARLESPEARSGWVEPDLAPLPAA